LVPAPEIMAVMADVYVKANTGKGLTARESMEEAVLELYFELEKRGHADGAHLIAAIVLGWQWRNEVTR